MDISVAEAQARLRELVERVTAGEEIVLMLDGKPAARLAPAQAAEGDLEERRRKLLDLSAEMASRAVPGPDAAHASNFLFDEFGLPG